MTLLKVTVLNVLKGMANLAIDEEAAQVILHRDAREYPHHTKRCWRSHLNRAQWMTEVGYRQLLTRSDS